MVIKIGKTPSIKNLLKNNDCVHLENVINEKITNMQDIIRNTILSIKSSKNQYIFSNNDSILSISLLSELYESIVTIKTEFCQNKNDPRKIIDSLQKINDKLMMIICGFGTRYMKDLLYINFYYDYNNIKIDNPLINAKFDLIKNPLLLFQIIIIMFF